MAESHRVVFTPSGLTGSVDAGTTVLDAARQLGADLDTVCGGRGICGRCQVVPGVGSFAKWGIDATADALSPPAQLEVDYHGNRPLLAGQRLGCSARICGDVVIDVPAMSQVHRQVVRKDLDLAPIVVDPTFSLFYVEVAPPSSVTPSARPGCCATPSPSSTGARSPTSTGGCSPTCTGRSPAPMEQRRSRSATATAPPI